MSDEQDGQIDSSSSLTSFVFLRRLGKTWSLQFKDIPKISHLDSIRSLTDRQQIFFFFFLIICFWSDNNLISYDVGLPKTKLYDWILQGNNSHELQIICLTLSSF